MPRSLPARVLRTIRDHELVGRGDRVAVALSGGSDSTALVWLFETLAGAGTLDRPVGLVHVNHGLRGKESDRDEEFCRALAKRLSLPIEVGRIDVARHAREERRSLEAVARDLRYQFFVDAAARLEATLVATGHTLDDQAETVLLRLLRGAGTRGLAGIRLRRGPFIRPLLECRRRDLQRFLAARREPFCEDSSNRSLAIARNRIRHGLLPVIEQLAPAGLRAIARTAFLADADEMCLARAATETAASLVLFSEAGVQVDSAGLAGLPPAIGRRLVRRLLEEAAAPRAISARHIEAMLRFARSDGGSGPLDLPGVAVTRSGTRLMLRAAATKLGAHPAENWEVALPVPGRVELPGLDASLSARVEDGGGVAYSVTDATVATIQAGAVALPLTVRTRRPGDRLRPLGAPGRRKLQDVLVDRKIPRAGRDRVPIVVDAAGRIVWVAGVTIADECRVTAPSAGVVVLKLNR